MHVSLFVYFSQSIDLPIYLVIYLSYLSIRLNILVFYSLSLSLPTFSELSLPHFLSLVQPDVWYSDYFIYYEATEAQIKT